MVRKILLAVVVLAVIGGGAYMVLNKPQAQSNPSVNSVGAQAAPVPASSSANSEAAAESHEFWTQRCNEEGDKYCEIFQRLMIRETNQRLIEFAVGYPKDSTGAQAAILLPLGVVIGEGIALRVDEKDPAKAAFRACNQDGCFVVMNLPEAFLADMKAGEKITVSFLDGNGQQVNVEMSLDGFAKKLSAVKS